MSNKRVILINPKTGPAFYTPPFSLMTLGTCLEKAGYKVNIVDCRIKGWKSYLDALLYRRDALYVGITSMTGPQIYHALFISQYVKENYNLKVVWGGIHASSLPEQTVANQFIDIVVVGWADKSIVELTDAIKNNSNLFKVKGISFKEDGKIIYTGKRSVKEIKTFTPYAWQLIEPQNYIADGVCRGKTISMITSRGCPYECTFCYGPAFHGRQWLAQSSEEVLEDIDILRDKADFESIYFHDDLFCVNKRRVIEIAKGLKERGIYFGFSIRPDDLDDQFCEILKENLCERIDWGAESGSNRMLEIYKKGFSVEDTLEGVRLCKKYGFSGQVGVIVGHPEETWEEVEQSLNLIDIIKRINPNQKIGDVKILTPYPGTEFYEEALKYGLSPPDSLEKWGEFYWNNVNLPWLKDKKKKLEVISFTSLIVFMHWRLKRRNLIYNLFLEIFHFLETYRWKKRFWNCAFEVKLMKIYLNMIIFSLKNSYSKNIILRWVAKLFASITEYF